MSSVLRSIVTALKNRDESKSIVIRSKIKANKLENRFYFCFIFANKNDYEHRVNLEKYKNFHNDFTVFVETPYYGHWVKCSKKSFVRGIMASRRNGHFPEQIERGILCNPHSEKGWLKWKDIEYFDKKFEFNGELINAFVDMLINGNREDKR